MFNFSSNKNVHFLLQADKVTEGEFYKILNSPIDCDERKTSWHEVQLSFDQIKINQS